MNMGIKMAIINGDGNRRDGEIIVALNKKNGDKDNNFEFVSLDSAEKYEQLESLFLKNKDVDYSDVTHINFYKEYLKKYRTGIFPSYQLDKFNSYNENTLFSLFSDMGNISILNSDYVTVIYLPKNISSIQRESLESLQTFFDSDKMVECKTIISLKKDDYVIDSYSSFDEFISSINLKGKK